MADWTITIAADTAAAITAYGKRHPRELASVTDNVKRVCTILNHGIKWGGFYFGFLRSEGGGLYRIGQTGVNSARETRLYVYPEQKTNTLHIVGIGDKDSQSRDIRKAQHTVSAIQSATGEQGKTP